MKVTAIIQARTGSTRLPKKVLMDLAGKTVLEHVINRVTACRLVDSVLVATTVEAEDDDIVKLCKKNNTAFFRGSVEDVLDRFYQAGKISSAEHIIRITADCPMMDPDVINSVAELHLKEKSDYTTNTLKLTYPDGEDVEIFTFSTLEKTWKNASLKSEREHVTSYMRKNPAVFKLSNLENSENLSDKRWTLDEEKDYKFISAIYAGIYKKNSLFGMSEIITYLKSHPEIEHINKHIGRNEGYTKSLKNDFTVKKI